MQLIATGAAVKERLRAAIVSGLISTVRTGLRGMARVDSLDHDPSLLRFVGNKAVQLRKGPGMQPVMLQEDTVNLFAGIKHIDEL